MFFTRSLPRRSVSVPTCSLTGGYNPNDKQYTSSKTVLQEPEIHSYFQVEHKYCPLYSKACAKQLENV